jgi:uncharacterized protein YigE (DUF2233 family)
MKRRLKMRPSALKYNPLPADFGLYVLLALLLSITALIAPLRAQPTPTPEPDAWTPLQDGVERRVLPVPGVRFGALTVIRIDPAQVRFSAHYSAAPRTVSEWQDALPDAALIINANLFQPDFSLIGLLIDADGTRHGAPLTHFGGAFYVDIEGAVSLRYNPDAPYDPDADAALITAVQGFPMLVIDGEAVFSATSGDRQTRRTVIALDDQGRVLLIVAPLFGPRLADLAAFLADSDDLEIVNALNLDGGGSTLLTLPDGTIIPSLDPVPAVLAVTMNDDSDESSGEQPDAPR